MGKLSFQKLDLEKNPIGEPVEVQFTSLHLWYSKAFSIWPLPLQKPA